MRHLLGRNLGLASALPVVASHKVFRRHIPAGTGTARARHSCSWCKAGRCRHHRCTGSSSFDSGRTVLLPWSALIRAAATREHAYRHGNSLPLRYRVVEAPVAVRHDDAASFTMVRVLGRVALHVRWQVGSAEGGVSPNRARRETSCGHHGPVRRARAMIQRPRARRTWTFATRWSWTDQTE